MEKIPFVNLVPNEFLAKELGITYDHVMNSGQYINGYEVAQFERNWADYCQAKYCVGVGNGFDALYIACLYLKKEGLGIVIQTPWKTCLPTWAAVSASGCYPDPREDCACMAVMAVHINGHVILPNSKGKPLIEDCAQAHGASLNGIMAGKFGQMACWSFYPTKNLGCYGDGGAITTDDEDFYRFALKMRMYGEPNDTGLNSRLDALQAAFLSVKLKYLDQWNAHRAENAEVYLNHIINDGRIKLPVVKEGEKPSWHIFAIETENRDDLHKYLRNNGVDTMIHYSTVPYPTKKFRIPEAEEWSRRTLSLPIAPHVNPDECKYISQLINLWLETNE